VQVVRLRRARIAVASEQVSILGASTAMEPAKTRKWTEEETRLLIELAQRKERVPAMARELGRHIASVRRRARELGLLLPQGRGEGQLSGGS
jgi:putative hemolysin